MKALIVRIFEKASFHGFVYVVRRDIHWIERTLWAGVLLFVAYFSVNICWAQWERYKRNPMVMSAQRIYGTREFPYMDVTLCSNYFDEDQAEEIIKATWNVSAEDGKKFHYYMEFLQLLTTVRYDNLKVLQRYADDPTVDNLDFLKILWEIRSTLYANVTTEAGQKESTGSTAIYGATVTSADDERSHFHSVITELGMCETMSKFHKYQDPRGFEREEEDDHVGVMCGPFDVCRLKVSPSFKDGNQTTVFIHDIGTALPIDSPDLVIRRSMIPYQIIQLDLLLENVEAESLVRSIPIQYRKCRFADENNLKFFDSYSEVHCRTECRLQAALHLCGCRPFFYVIGSGPMCTVEGMMCLVQEKWKDTECAHCYGRCAFNRYTALLTTTHDYSSSQFETTVLISLSFPQIGNKRLVVFSFDQLVVTFGGAASLFLGCSFLSFAQIFYICIQSAGARLRRMWRRRK